MSYASLIKTLPETLRSSTGKAALASLGIHGLLWVVLPVLPFDSKPVESQLQRTVGLIELTPAEQIRLPQVSTSQVTIPPVATQASGLPPLPSASSLPPSVLPPLPPASSLPPGVLPPLPPPPVLNLPPSGVPPIYNYPLRASLPQPQTIQVPLSAPNQNNQLLTPQLDLSKLPAPAPSQTYRLQQLPPPPFAPPANRSLPSTTGLKPEPFSSPDTGLNPNPQQNNNQLNTNQPTANQLQNQPQNQQVATNLETPSTTATRPEKIPESTKQQLLTLREKLREQSARDRSGLSTTAAQRKALAALLARQTSDSEIARASRVPKLSTTAVQPEKIPNTKQQLLLALQAQLRQSNRNRASSTSPATAEKLTQLRTWSEREDKVRENYPNLLKNAPIYKTIKTCDPGLAGMAVLGVVVNSEGKIVSGPDLLDKKGAAVIEQTAKNYVREYGFPKTVTFTNQEFNLQFKYNTSNCSERTPEPSWLENTDTKRPQL